MAECPYAGKIKNQSVNVVKGPYAQDGKKGKTITHKGTDLRAGKTKG